MSPKTVEKILKQFRNYAGRPADLLFLAAAALRGCFFIVLYRLVSRGRVIIRFPFFAHTRVRISGRGKVLIESGCSAYINGFEHLTIVTLTEHAAVTIGRRCMLGGATIRCAQRIQVGKEVMMAGCLIQDVLYFSLPRRQDSADAEPGAPIVIGDSVWLSGRSVVLAGSSLGRGSVLAVGALIYGASVGEQYLMLGNPACRPLPIGNIQKMKSSVS